MALDQATSAFIEQMAAAGGKPIHECTPDEARTSSPLLTQLIGRGPDVASSEDVTLRADDGGSFTVRVLKPDQPEAVIVYYHGGGWVTGDLAGFDTLGRVLATRTKSTVVLVDYRLAPEFPYPVPVEDSWAALRWADERRATLAHPNAALIVAGDSAGGNLSAIMAQRSKQRGAPALAHQVLVYPVTDADFDRPSYRAAENQALLTREGMIWFFDHYTGDRDIRRDPEVSPLHATDLSGLAPATVVLAQHDPLHDEGAAYAAALADAGVPVRVEEITGQMHGFFSMVNILPGATTGMDIVVDQITAAVRETAGVR